MPVDHLQTLLRWERNSWLVALWDICVPGLHISRLRVDSGVKQAPPEFAEHAVPIVFPIELFQGECCRRISG
jgi:hypothetical protein